MAIPLPIGFDRADGEDGRIGTMTPDGAVFTDLGPVENLAIEELPESPTIERAEQATFTKEFRMSWQDGLSLIPFYHRGLVMDDSFGNKYKLLSADMRHEKGGTCIFRMVWEAVSFDNPPDQFQCIPVELGVNIMKHPRYLYAFTGGEYGSATELLNQPIIRMLQNYFENTNAQYRDSIALLFKNSMDFESPGGTQPPVYSETAYFGTDHIQGTNLAKAAGLEILQKFWRGEETPYVIGYQITQSTFYWLPQYLNPGGYIEDPITSGELHDYFWSPAEIPDGRTIFDLMAAINPQCYSDDGTSTGRANISWLRKADEIEFERTWYKITRTWIGSAVGFWDTQLYTAIKRPTSAGDYNILS